MKLEDVRINSEKKRRRIIRNRRYIIRENSRSEAGRSRTSEQERE